MNALMSPLANARRMPLYVWLSILTSALAGSVLADQRLAVLPDGSHKQTKWLNREYLIRFPKEYKTVQKSPLLIFLHGRGGQGNDIKRMRGAGPRPLFQPRANYPFIVVSPQCNKAERGKSRWQAGDLNLLLEHLKATYKIDEERIYLTGLSMGGYGTWTWAAQSPEIFAAIAPICGGAMPEKAGRIVHLPIWIFHGVKDKVVPIQESEQMVQALKQHGARQVKFTRYPEAGHNCWDKAYGTAELYKWLLAHSRGKAAKHTFEKTTFKTASGRDLRYAILELAKVDTDRKYPLVITLHGIGGRGAKDWERNCYANSVLAKPAMRTKFPCFVVAPTVDKPSFWAGDRL
ncbi:MAG: prolyl oligopeptidase family serine peptidase, partial [Candidatus Hydrogenedentes bacterium]|nr:prolyl oligopeptidase family serine peptidase [Candidatus Hydrogenedentota bacterium]